MAGAIGGSVGALVSSVSNPIPGTDATLCLNTAGRAASSIAYDLSYDLFDTGKIDTSIAMYICDVTLDVVPAPVNYYYTGNLANGFLRTAINGIVEGVVDIFQTIVLFE